MSTALKFVDCSSNNPIPNLLAYKAAGHRDIMRKVTEGTGYQWFEGNGVADRAHAIGLRVGHYHWLRPDSDALAQARFFVNALEGHTRAGDFLVTDFEATAGVPDHGDHFRADQLRTFNRYVKAHYPALPLYVYTGNWYLDGKPECQRECRQWGVIMSNYSDVPSLPNPYALHYVAWQFSDHAHVAGFSAPVDYNRWLIPHPDPSTTVKEFTVDAQAKARFDAIDAKLAQIDKYFVGTDGHHHTVEVAVAHVTQGAGYKSKKGTIWARLFRRREARPSIVVPPAVKK